MSHRNIINLNIPTLLGLYFTLFSPVTLDNHPSFQLLTIHVFFFLSSLISLLLLAIRSMPSFAFLIVFAFALSPLLVSSRLTLSLPFVTLFPLPLVILASEVFNESLNRLLNLELYLKRSSIFAPPAVLYHIAGRASRSLINSITFNKRTLGY